MEPTNTTHGSLQPPFKSNKDAATYYGVSTKTVLRLRAKGVDINDVSLVNSLKGRRNHDALLAGFRESKATAPRPDSAVGASGIASALESLRQAERTAHAALVNAPLEKQPILQKLWLEIVTELRQTEREITKIQEANEKSLPYDEVEKKFLSLFSLFRSELDSIPGKWNKVLSGCKDECELENKLKHECTELVKRFFSFSTLEEIG